MEASGIWAVSRRAVPRARSVEDGLLAVEVDELPQRERVSDEVGGGVFETLLVLRRDALPHVCGEAGMPPAEQLLDELVGDGVSVEQAGEDSLAEQSHQECGVPLR
jgi:hypothetical protein